MSKMGQYVQQKQAILDDARAKNVPVADILEHMGNQATDFVSAWERFIETEKSKQQWIKGEDNE